MIDVGMQTIPALFLSLDIKGNKRRANHESYPQEKQAAH